MPTVSATALVVGPWHWAACFPSTDRGLSGVLRVSQAVRVSARSPDLALELAPFPAWLSRLPLCRGGCSAAPAVVFEAPCASLEKEMGSPLQNSRLENSMDSGA